MKATHTDRWGMPVAFAPDIEVNGKTIPNTGGPFYPSPCCGASAKGCDGYIGCRACYKPIDPSYGGVPEEPFTPLA